MDTHISQIGTLLPFIDPLPLPPTMLPIPDAAKGYSHLRIRMKVAQIQLHQDLPAADMWTYEGFFPGPTIEVKRGQKVVVEWVNNLQGPLPYKNVIAPDAQGNDPAPQNIPGANGASDDPKAAGIEPWTVVHLHGGKTEPDSDGWTENVLLTGQSRMGTYHNDQAGTLLWYHDHAMDITRYNVYAGLAGLWVIRDEEEARLPEELRENEIPLLIQDRNLETDDQGKFTGQILHKIEDGTREFFGPYTLVNGKIWPHLDVHAEPYRFRVINGSNSRIYRLVLLDADGNPCNDGIVQIGTDGGLLGMPVTFSADEGIILAPAERADLVIDFTRFRGQHLKLVNSAGAPFHGALSILTPGVPDLENRLPYPDVMQFRVGHQQGKRSLALPQPLSPSFVRLTHDMPHSAHRVVALVEDSDMHMLTLRELVEATDPQPGEPVVEIQDGANPPQKFHVAARNFEDTVNFIVPYGANEVWKFINLTEDTHPMHVHLVQFQALSRRTITNPDVFDLKTDSTSAPLQIDAKATDPDDNEQGWKDTIRANPKEMLTIMAKFEGFAGRYMYHCHIIEHEDSEMMRPFVVLPLPIAEQMGNMGSGHHHP